jgi:hypothetical protein
MSEPAPRAPYPWSARGWPSERPSDDPDALEVWGFAERFCYLAGETLRLHVSCSAAAFSIEIMRDGARPEPVLRRTGLPGRRAATPADAYAVGCDWPVGFELIVPSAWRAGFYLVRLSVGAGEQLWESEAFFVVRRPAGRRGRMALLLTTSTMLAYNDWGGANHYRGLGDDPREDVASPVLSTRRPVARGMLRKPAGAPRDAHDFTPPMFWQPRYPAYEWARLYGYGRHHADAFWATYERPFVVWAESQGYEFDYLTQHELHFDAASLDEYACVVIVGHDEYWTWEMRDRIDAFVDRGGGLARFAGNFLWQVRLSPDGTRQFCYRIPARDPEAARDPRRATTVWDHRAVGRPAAATMGLTAMGGTYNRFGVAAPRSSGGFTIYRPEHWAFAGTDLYYGDLLGGAPTCLAAFELDSVDYTMRRGLPYPTFEDGAPETLEILALAPAVKGEEDRFDGRAPMNGPIRESQALLAAIGADLPECIREAGGRGAGMIAAFTRGRGCVFNGGSTEWPHALEVGDPFVARIVRNVLDRFGGET